MPRARTLGLNAEIVQVLQYMDGPQAVLLSRSEDRKIVAVAVDRPNYKYPFLGTEIDYTQWERYRRGFVDLHYLFTLPKWKRWFLFDLGAAENSRVTLQPVEKGAFTQSDFPDQGFFAYDHSEPIEETKIAGLVTKRFSTDGKWELADFSEFYGKVSDLYAFFLSLKKYADGATPLAQRRRIRETFADAPLRGGSSYVTLYRSLGSTGGYDERLHTGELKYASAGWVDVHGRPDVFTEMSVALQQFMPDYEDIKTRYNFLHKFLSTLRLLREDASDAEISAATTAEIKGYADALAAAMNMPDRSVIFDLSERSTVKYTKIILAHFRRLERYFLFFAEGRVKE
jgi:hypothetical protein